MVGNRYHKQPLYPMATRLYPFPRSQAWEFMDVIPSHRPFPRYRQIAVPRPFCAPPPSAGRLRSEKLCEKAVYALYYSGG